MPYKGKFLPQAPGTGNRIPVLFLEFLVFQESGLEVQGTLTGV
jgi:hypothetical protein